jgi:hypothetical protein
MHEISGVFYIGVNIAGTAVIPGLVNIRGSLSADAHQVDVKWHRRSPDRRRIVSEIRLLVTGVHYEASTNTVKTVEATNNDERTRVQAKPQNWRKGERKKNYPCPKSC